MEALQSIAELQSQSYILHRRENGMIEQIPWTVTYHFPNTNSTKEIRDSFSLETTSVWADTSLRTSCRLKSELPDIPSELVAAFAAGIAIKMASWNLVRTPSSNSRISKLPKEHIAKSADKHVQPYPTRSRSTIFTKVRTA